MDAPTPHLSAELLLEHTPFVRSLARGLLHDEHLVDDVVQETWLRLSTRPLRDPRGVRSWMRAVVQRISIDRARERSRRAAREAQAARPEALPSVAEELAHTEVLRSVVEAVLALDEPYRTCVLLAYWRGWDARRIAKETRTPLATIRSRLQRAHAKVRERLDRSHTRESWMLALVTLGTRQLASPIAMLAMGTGAKLAAGLLALGALVTLLWQTIDRPVLPPATPGETGPIAIAAPVGSEEEAASEAHTEERSELSRAAPSEGIRIAGQVTDLACPELGLAEQPASDLEMRIGLASSEYGPRNSIASVSIRTSADGRFELALSDPGSRPLFVRISVPEDEDHRQFWLVQELGGTAEEFHISRAAHGVLHGTVVDDLGEPLEGARLYFEGRDSGIEVVSARDGSFSIPRLHPSRQLEAELASYSLLEWDRPEPLDQGGWSPMRVCMAREAALSVRVVDRNDEGIPEAHISVELDASEKAALEIGWSLDEQKAYASTDERGIARIPGLWAQRKLELSIRIGNESFDCNAAVGNELVLAEANRASGEPIVVLPGEMLELVARIAVEREIAGRVVLPGGNPVPLARVSVADLGRGGGAWSRPELARCETDAEGRFTTRIRTAELHGPLQIRAETASGAPAKNGLGALGYGGESDQTVTAKGAATLDPANEEALRAIEIVLDPCLAMAGTVRDAAGGSLEQTGFGARIWAAAAEDAFDLREDRVASIAADGSFTIAGLPPGTYDLFVSEENESFYSFTNFVHRFPSIAAGSQNLELRLPARREARIRVRLLGDEVAAGIVLHRKLFPSEPESFAAPRAGVRTLVTGAAGWPEGTVFDFTGISGATLAVGTCMDGYDALEGPEHALQPLEPGWYAIAIYPRDAGGGERWFPQATQILYFKEGEHLVDFELLPAATLRGRVLGATQDEFLAVTLVDEKGLSVPLLSFGGRAMHALVHDASASGEFVLHYAPTGKFRLRAGSRAELERGEFRRELALEIRAGENARIELQL